MDTEDKRDRATPYSQCPAPWAPVLPREPSESTATTMCFPSEPARSLGDHRQAHFELFPKTSAPRKPLEKLGELLEKLIFNI